MSKSRVSALYTYPVKSCAPIAMTSSFCSKVGLPFDRQYVIANEDGTKFFTQRDLPALAIIQPVLIDENTLGLKRFDETPIIIPGTETGDLVKLNVWGNDYLAVDQGEQIARWLTSAIGSGCRLYKRAASDESADDLHQDHTRYDAAFVDCCPLSIVFESELRTLNAKLDKPIAMSRFRPSIVIDDLENEQNIVNRNLSVGAAQLAYIRQIGRCVIINIDQERGSLTGPEPLKVLASYSLVKNKAALGHYYVAENACVVSIGDFVESFFMTPA